VPAGFYGVNVQQVFDGSSSSWAPDLSAMAGGGLSLARIDARWENVEPNPPSGGTHTYNWSMYDGIVQGLAEHGLRWLPIVDYSASWSGVNPGQDTSAVAPAYVPDFAAYAAALARRYGPGGSFWTSHPSLTPMPVTEFEIWNEENSTVFWQPQAGNAEAYADLYLAARNAIKGVNSQARVYIGGLALANPPAVSDEVDFIKRMYAHRPDLAGNVDGVGLHPYQANVYDTYMRLARFRQALNSVAGASVPIEVTEVGWSSSTVSESQRAADLTQLAEELPRSDCNVDRFLPYTWITEESNQNDPEQWFGIWNRDGSPKPSGQAYLNAVELMRGMTSTPAPSAPVAICSVDYDPAPPAPPPVTPHPPPVKPPRGPRLILRVRRHHRTTLVVAGQCHAGCKLSVSLLATKKPAHESRVTMRQTHFSSRRQLVHLRLSKRFLERARHARVVVVAIGRNGARTTASRRLKLH
jgi:hypothetical protein